MLVALVPAAVDDFSEGGVVGEAFEFGVWDAGGGGGVALVGGGCEGGVD